MDNGDHKIVINELLSYCSYHLDNSSAESIKKVVLNFYHPDEIIAASNVLSKECADVAGTAVRHCNTPARGAHVAHADDVIKTLVKIDRDAGDQPIFVAAKLDRLPRYSPEEIDLISVVERLNDLERKFAHLDHTVAKQTDTMAMILDAQCRRGYADAARQRVSEQVHNARSVVNENPRQPPGPQVAGPVQELNFEKHSAEQALQDTESSDADDTGAGDAVIDVSNSGSAGEAADGFVLPREQIKRQNRRNNANNLIKLCLVKVVLVD